MNLQNKYKTLIHAAADVGAPSHLLRACFCLLSVARSIDSDCATRLKKYNLSEGKFVLVFFLAQSAKGLSPTELARLAGVTKATVTGLSDGLVRIGLVRRTFVETDRRSFTLELTQKGRKVADQVLSEHSVWISSLFETFTEEKLKQMEVLLTSVWKQTDEGRRVSKLSATKSNGQRRPRNAKN